jgi:hypothetical protein
MSQNAAPHRTFQKFELLFLPFRNIDRQPKALVTKSKTMIPLRLELRTACVLDRSDNQLHHRTIDVRIQFRTKYISHNATRGCPVTEARSRGPTCRSSISNSCENELLFIHPSDLHLRPQIDTHHAGEHTDHELYTDHMFFRQWQQCSTSGAGSAPASIGTRSSLITSKSSPLVSSTTTTSLP